MCVCEKAAHGEMGFDSTTLPKRTIGRKGIPVRLVFERSSNSPKLMGKVRRGGYILEFLRLLVRPRAKANKSNPNAAQKV